jgi:hypothetical protein
VASKYSEVNRYPEEVIAVLVLVHPGRGHLAGLPHFLPELETRNS